jgi:hypothetical protein
MDDDLPYVFTPPPRLWRDMVFVDMAIATVIFGRRALQGAAILACVMAPAVARAQSVHWDAGVAGGVMRRVLTSRPADDAGFGGMLEARAHVALVPMVRAGLYFETDVSPMSGFPSRHFYAGGLRAKVTPPWIRTDTVATYAFFGLGYVSSYGPSFPIQVTNPNGTAVTGLVDGASGQFFEVPIGIGATWTVRKPWQLFAELGMRLGFAHGGTLYGLRSAHVSGVGAPDLTVDPAGYDAYAFFLAVGVAFDR